MSLYRTLIAAVAAMSLTSVAFAADDVTTTDTSAPAAQVASTDQATPAADTQDIKVNLNTATAKELMKIKGLSAAKVKAIVAYRKKHGDFKALEDLKQVKGFKKMNDDTMKKIQDQLTLG